MSLDHFRMVSSLTLNPFLSSMAVVLVVLEEQMACIRGVVTYTLATISVVFSRMGTKLSGTASRGQI